MEAARTVDNATEVRQPSVAEGCSRRVDQAAKVSTDRWDARCDTAELSRNAADLEPPSESAARLHDVEQLDTGDVIGARRA